LEDTLKGLSFAEVQRYARLGVEVERQVYGSRGERPIQVSNPKNPTLVGASPVAVDNHPTPEPEKPKKLHWTQRPGGREKMRKAARKGARRRRRDALETL